MVQAPVIQDTPYLRTNMALFAWLVHDHKDITYSCSAGSPAAVPLVDHSAMWTPIDKRSAVPGCAFTKCRRLITITGERYREKKGAKATTMECQSAEIQEYSSTS